MEGARRALPDDLEACARLLEDARGHAAGLRGGPELLTSSLTLPAPPQPIDAAWLAQHWTTSADALLLAGTIEDAVVGIAAGRICMRGGERVGSIDCCYVEADARGVGVGSALAESLIRWFSEAGCVSVDAPALPGDRATKQLFESQGLSARLLILHRRLP